MKNKLLIVLALISFSANAWFGNYKGFEHQDFIEM